MCHLSSDPCVSAEEPVAAEECLVVYCKPVELYNILQRRAHHNPSFLPRCLSYKIEAKWKSSLMDGNVIFNYKDQSSLLRKTEVTRQFSCPFCLMKCGSFKGLRFHLLTSHDLFKCEFWVTKEYRAVNVSVNTDAVNSESEVRIRLFPSSNDTDTAGEIEPQLQPFCYCSRPRKRKKPEDPLEKGKYVYPHVLEPPIVSERLVRGTLESNGDQKDPISYANMMESHDSRFLRENRKGYENGNANNMDYGPAASGVPVARAQSLEDVDCVDKNVVPPVIPSAKSKKLSFERSETRSAALLQKRQFYHSHRAQPMSLEQVLSDRDSEDEDDDDISDLEDRRMLDDFVDVTKDEKHLMHLWNTFVRKQRVLADGHVPWACEAFLRLHGKKLINSQALFWCWKLFMVKLWNHGLLDASTMNNCSMILQEHQDEGVRDGKCASNSKAEPSNKGSS